MKALLIFCIGLCSACIGFDAEAELAPQQIQQAAANIDALLAVHWKTAGVSPLPPISDETFVRRIYLDLAGRIPTANETATFLAAKEPGKRAVLIGSLLARESYVSHFYNFWADILRYKSHYPNTADVVPAAYERFIKESLRMNKPYDLFVRELLSAKGYAWDNGAIGYYERDPDMPLDNMAITARIFLGTRIECAQCHDHPFDKWKQTDFYHLAAYTYGNRPVSEAFGGARDAIRARQEAILADCKKEKAVAVDGGKAAEQRKTERMDAMEYRKIVGIIKGCVGQIFSPIGLERRDSILKLPHDFHQSDGRPGDVINPKPIFGTARELAPAQDPAEVFAKWMTAPQNSRFTAVIVNRLWKKLFGVGLIEPVDEVRDDTRSMVPEVEAYAEKLMVATHYDVKAFLAVIANTRAYQSAVSPQEFTRGDVYHFQGPILRRMTAEQIWDSLVVLASYEPDARDLVREARHERRIAVSHMACDAYLNFDGTRLVELAYSDLQKENEIEKNEKEVKGALISAKHNGDKAKEIELRHREGELTRERGQALVRDFITPLLNNLAQLKAGPNARPVVDETYKVNSNPAVLTSETWKRMYVPGYGPAPKTYAQVDAEAKTEKRRLAGLAVNLGFPEKDRDAFVSYCEKARLEWLRASELDSPAPRGHFLRIMGQSDREFVENANFNASIPQALALMNSDIISAKGLLSPFSPLMCFVNRSRTPEEKVEAAYLALLSRKSTAQEKARWSNASERGLKTIDDLIFAVLNTKQFIFIQ